MPASVRRRRSGAGAGPGVTVLAVGLLAACSPEEPTVLFVKVTTRPGVRETTSLEATFRQGESNKSTVFSKKGAALSFPTSFVVRADGLQGPAIVSAVAKNQQAESVGQGEISASLLDKQRVDATLTLLPTDFQANDRHQTSQLFSPSAAARQVASDGKGNAVAVWEDSCPQQRCDIFYRLFDENGAPKPNGVTNDTEEYVANEANAHYDTPAVAVHKDGAFVITWFRYDQSTNTKEIRSRSFLPNGRPDEIAKGGAEMLLSAAGAVSVGTPDVAALLDHNYVVVWHQVDGAQWQVMGRFLGPHGRPTKRYDDKNEPFLVASFDQSPSLPPPNPAVAPGKNNGFAVVWRHEGKLYGRTFEAAAKPTSVAFEITGSDKIGGFDIAPLLAGYAAVWEDGANCAQDASPSCIRLRRFSLVGAAKELAWTVNTTTDGSQKDPAVAMRSDGSLLVAWSSVDDNTTDDQGGIRGRKVLSGGLPVGDDFPLNTTTIAAQDRPSLAPHNAESYILLYRDASRTGADQDGTAIRARLLYPDFDARDGLVGAHCDNGATCSAGLQCAPTEKTTVGARCVRTCASAADCLDGGTCETSSQLCVYSQ